MPSALLGRDLCCLHLEYLLSFCVTSTTLGSTGQLSKDGVSQQHEDIYTRKYTRTHLPHIHHHRVELATISVVQDVSSIAKIKSKIGPVFLWQQLLETF